MPGNIETIAAQIYNAEMDGYLPGRIALHAHLADEVRLRRVPPLPEDGVRSRDRFLEMWLSEATAYEMLQDFRQENVAVSVTGDQISLHRTRCATTSDGEALRIPIVQILTIEDDKIVAMEVHMTPDDVTRMSALIETSGLPHADVPMRS